jgi:hypothetical protein
LKATSKTEKSPETGKVEENFNPCFVRHVALSKETDITLLYSSEHTRVPKSKNFIPLAFTD